MNVNANGYQFRYGTGFFSNNQSKTCPGRNWYPAVVLGLFLALMLSGCGESSYPEDKVASAIQEICSKEYKIENVEVKFAGKTIGVFLPLKKLFTADIREEILSGNVANLESLFEPEPEAMEQLENVLFTISRVLLSSDRPIDFYTLQATDVESTGLQLVLMGYVDDVKRVRLWDISRGEYRKRVLHELKFNRSVLWEKPVRGFLQEFSRTNYDELTKRYFSGPISPETVSPLFYDFLVTAQEKQNLKLELKGLKSRPYRDARALVYAKWSETFEPPTGSTRISAYPSGTTLEYIFVVAPVDKQFKIFQVIPFNFLDGTGRLQKVILPPDLNIDQNLASWPERFTVEEIKLGDFLVRQMNRRIQGLLLSDERVHHTIRHAQVNFAYQAGDDSSQKPSFALHFDFITKGMRQSAKSIDQMVSDEDILYLFDLILREFADVVRSYRFQDFSYLDLIWEPGHASAVLRVDPDRLDLFRERKLKIAALLESPKSPTALF